MKDKPTLVKKRLMEFIGKRYPLCEDCEKIEIANDMIRFVNVIQRIYYEPQPTVKMEYRKENGKTVKDTTINLSSDEFFKILKNKKSMPLDEAFREVHDIATRNRRRHAKQK